ncbi:MAG TPA: UPF0280 family protein [Sunxiuqinia sp.]|nr:UPF0280 family protein [Sunxiuqinia sp.]
MIFEPKTYRNSFSKERFQSFVITYKEADLWVGVDPDSFQEEMKELTLSKLKTSWDELEAYLSVDPFFKKSLKYCPVQDTAPTVAKQMAAAGEKAGVGPMASQEAIFCELVGKALLENFSIHEMVIENGGKLFVSLQNPLTVSIFAGDSPLSGMVGLEIKAEQTPLGVCTSAQTERTPMNFGKADAVIVASKNPALADAFSTSLGNLIKKPGDVEKVLKRADNVPEIIAAVLVCEDQIGIRGEFELKMLS